MREVKDPNLAIYIKIKTQQKGALIERMLGDQFDGNVKMKFMQVCFDCCVFLVQCLVTSNQ